MNLISENGTKVHTPNGRGGTLCGAGELCGVYAYDGAVDCKRCLRHPAAVAAKSDHGGDEVATTSTVKMYEKTSNGITCNIPFEEGEWILSHYRGDGSRFVKSLTRTSSGTYEIMLKRGEK